MREEDAQKTPGLVKRTGQTFLDPQQSYAKRVGAGAALAGAPAVAVLGGAAGVQALNGLDPSLVSAVGQHLAFGGDMLGHMAGPIGWATGLGISVAIQSSTGKEHPFQRPVRTGMRRVAAGSGIVTGLTLGGAGVAEVVDLVAHTHAAAGAIGGLENAAATAAMVGATSYGLSKLWSIGLKRHDQQRAAAGKSTESLAE